MVTLVKLEPKGIPPPGRYMHTMTYYQEKSLVTISGGRNDQLSNIVLGDLWVLRLDDLEYAKVIIRSELLIKPRYNHTAVQFGSKMIVFGGMNQDMSLEMTVQEFELDSDVIDRKLKQENDKRKQQQLADSKKPSKASLFVHKKAEMVRRMSTMSGGFTENRLVEKKHSTPKTHTSFVNYKAPHFALLNKQMYSIESINMEPTEKPIPEAAEEEKDQPCITVPDHRDNSSLTNSITEDDSDISPAKLTTKTFTRSKQTKTSNIVTANSSQDQTRDLRSQSVPVARPRDYETAETDPKMILKAHIAERRRKSTRIADILENKLQESSNIRGNIIFNSLGSYRRNHTKHSGTTTPVADPKVYQIIGKLHTRVALPTTYSATNNGSSVSKLDLKKLPTSVN